MHQFSRRGSGPSVIFTVGLLLFPARGGQPPEFFVGNFRVEEERCCFFPFGPLYVKRQEGVFPKEWGSSLLQYLVHVPQPTFKAQLKEQLLVRRNVIIIKPFDGAQSKKVIRARQELSTMPSPTFQNLLRNF
jgi:hypothetical protein